MGTSRGCLPQEDGEEQQDQIGEEGPPGVPVLGGSPELQQAASALVSSEFLFGPVVLGGQARSFPVSDVHFGTCRDVAKSVDLVLAGKEPQTQERFLKGGRMVTTFGGSLGVARPFPNSQTVGSKRGRDEEDMFAGSLPKLRKKFFG